MILYSRIDRVIYLQKLNVNFRMKHEWILSAPFPFYVYHNIQIHNKHDIT